MAAAVAPVTVRLYPITNYRNDTTKDKFPLDTTQKAADQRLRESYAKEGMRRSVHAAILVHNHKHPHLLLLKSDNPTKYMLPGAELLPGETESDGMTRVLNKFFAGSDPAEKHEWPVIDLLSEWWRPNFDGLQYPYLPVHCTKPREQARIFLVQLPEACGFKLPANLALNAVALHDLHQIETYGGMTTSSIPALLSRFNFSYL
mmetsp:Transcript_18874/g.55993  ORF Transcript_18874/g.55993 Transcript_18874/m.55993 type:complete len:203 (+) Transcript_18874:252-860(+)